MIPKMIGDSFYKFYNGFQYKEFLEGLLLGIAVSLLYFLIKFVLGSVERSIRRAEQDYLNTFEALFQVHIRNRFPNQSADCLSCLKNGVRTALRHKSSRRPAVLLLLHTDQTRSTAMSLAARLLRVCLAAVGKHKAPGYVERYLTVDGREYSTLSDFWGFYTALKEKIGEAKMVIVHNFQAVHPHAVTLVSTFTHEMLSPDNQAIVVLLLEMGWYSEGRTECTTSLAESWIEQSFGHALDDAARQDLLSTLTARAAVVREECILPKEN